MSILFQTSPRPQGRSSSNLRYIYEYKNNQGTFIISNKLNKCLFCMHMLIHCASDGINLWLWIQNGRALHKVPKRTRYPHTCKSHMFASVSRPPTVWTRKSRVDAKTPFTFVHVRLLGSGPPKTPFMNKTTSLMNVHIHVRLLGFPSERKSLTYRQHVHFGECTCQWNRREPTSCWERQRSFLLELSSRSVFTCQ